MQFGRVCFLSVVALLWCSAFVRAQVVHMTADTQKSLDTIHQGLQKVRSEIYGNCHLVVSETDVAIEPANSKESEQKEVSQKRRYEFWSRENKYFRVDTLSTQPGEENVVLERTIIRPDRFVDFRRSKKGQIVVNGWGAATDVLVKFGGYRFFHGSTRRFPLDVEMWYADYKNVPQFEHKVENPDLKIDVSVSTDSPGRVRVVDVAVSPKGKSTTTVVCDTEHDGVVHSYETEFSSVGNSIRVHGSVKYEYSTSLSEHIPIRVIDDRTFSNGKRSLVTTEVTVAELGPAPLEVFSIEGFGLEGDTQGLSWTRRGIMIGIGAAIAVAYFVLRRRKDPDVV